jgi:serine/threonine kinase PknH
MLGRGGMGEVYEAYDTVKDRVVALKLMSEQFTSDDVFRERVQREAHTAGRLQEPHIVPIHDYGEIDGHLFIDMRFVHGIDVGSVLRRDGPMAPPRAVAIIGQIASALDAAHASGVIHRDIKPENVLLTKEDFACLVNFGIAAAFTDTHLTKADTATGTWKYMAPERFGDDEITYRVDIYALACVLYECLTGVPPYPTDNLPAVMAAHLTQPVPQASHQNPAIPTALDHVIACGMAKNPADRYNSAGDLARAAHRALLNAGLHQAAGPLAHSQHHAPPLSGPVPWHHPPPWAGPPPRHNRKPWLIAAATMTVLALAGAGIWVATKNTPDQKTTTARTTPTTTTVPAAATPRTPLPSVAPAHLQALLPNEGQIGIMVVAPYMKLSATINQLDPTNYGLSLPDCDGALNAGQAPVYAGSGYTGVWGQKLDQPANGTVPHMVIQVVVAYPTADQALALVTSSAQKWKACAGKPITMTFNGDSRRYTFGPLVGEAPKITQLDTAEEGSQCQHALSAVSNVVIDVVGCGLALTNDADRIADAIAVNVSR